MTSLAAHLAIKAKEAVIDNQLDCLQLKLDLESPRKVKQHIRRADRNINLAFVCLQSLDRTPLLVKDIIFAWLNRRIGSLDSFLTEKQRSTDSIC
ncbi:hypothetical protein [Legionella tunisiensis]|uniref:hypothetical protein n=1 Tax=Legionella tunisiensis TaxID=1034944 RepID=UPI0002E06B2C|nr:hypothetical protein [Legionella tunisiensis]